MWRETSREVHTRRSGEPWTYVLWRCSSCRKIAVSGGEMPSECVCRSRDR
jgi:hypothetical protein